MNYFAHGRPHVDDPYRLAGTAIPDWLGVVDRKVRVRPRQAATALEDDDPRVVALARGVMQHHHDDAWFHETRAFAELSMGLSLEIRDHLADFDGLRPGFLGHIVVEILLDAVLVAESPVRLEQYYDALTRVDPAVVQTTVERLSGRACPRLAEFIPRFLSERFLWDYLDDAKLVHRLNQVMRRVGLDTLPDCFLDLLPEARRRISARHLELLTPDETVDPVVPVVEIK